jgi:hypothetical protein
MLSEEKRAYGKVKMPELLEFQILGKYFQCFRLRADLEVDVIKLNFFLGAAAR